MSDERIQQLRRSLRELETNPELLALLCREGQHFYGVSKKAEVTKESGDWSITSVQWLPACSSCGRHPPFRLFEFEADSHVGWHRLAQYRGRLIGFDYASGNAVWNGDLVT